MLSRLFGRKSAGAPKPGPQLAMPALRSTKGLTDSSIVGAWKKLFPSAPIASDPGGKGEFSFSSGEARLIMVPMDMPIPAGDIDSACARSWMWKEAAEAMRAQKAHLVVACLPGESAAADALAVSRLVAAICAAGDPVGVYWGNCSQVHKPEMFIDAVKTLTDDDAQRLPVMLWVGLVISADSPKGPFTLSTWGLRPFGHKELEIIDTHLPVGDLRMLVYEIINYLLVRGPILKHGETFGRSAQERFKVEHTTSRFRKGEGVIRLHIP